jgi:hypothetical protein
VSELMDHLSQIDHRGVMMKSYAEVSTVGNTIDGHGGSRVRRSSGTTYIPMIALTALSMWCVASIECMKSDPNMYQSSYNWRELPGNTHQYSCNNQTNTCKWRGYSLYMVLSSRVCFKVTRRLPPYVLSIPVDPSAWILRVTSRTILW